MIITDQKINDTTPYTLSVLIGTGSGSLGLTAVWMVIGLVPMSPNTTPSAPPKLQCKTGRSGLGSSRPNLRTPASAGHPSQPSLGRDTSSDDGAVLEVCGRGVVAMDGVNVVKPPKYSAGKESGE